MLIGEKLYLLKLIGNILLFCALSINTVCFNSVFLQWLFWHYTIAQCLFFLALYWLKQRICFGTVSVIVQYCVLFGSLGDLALCLSWHSASFGNTCLFWHSASYRVMSVLTAVYLTLFLVMTLCVFCQCDKYYISTVYTKTEVIWVILLVVNSC